MVATIREDLVKRAVDVALSGADLAEERRRLPEETVDALAEAGLLQMCLPVELGGPGVDPLTTIGLIERVAYADGAAGFLGEYGVLPTYECLGDGGFDDPTVPDMLEAVPGSINGGGGLTNSGEFLCLFYWDGNSDLVTDLDYVCWGDLAEAVD